VPLSATAQLLLPGTEAIAEPDQVIVLPETVAVAEPVPDIGTLPLHVAENVPLTDVAVALVMVQVNPPHVPAAVGAFDVDLNVPAPTVVVRTALDGDVAPVEPQAALRKTATAIAATDWTRMGEL
jgi:hypothetical protein